MNGNNYTSNAKIHNYALLTCFNLLKQYTSGAGQSISIHDIFREVFVEAWGNYGKIPDHQLKNILQKNYGKIASVSEYILCSLKILTNNYLYLSENTLYIRKDKFAEWQNIITSNSPLTLMAYYISSLQNKDSFPSLINTNIAPSPLPTFHDKIVENTLACQELIDIHMHLNGSSLADAIWESALRDPVNFRLQMRFESKSHAAAHEEFFAQSCSFFQWEDIPTLIDIAACLRDWLARCLMFFKNRVPCGRCTRSEASTEHAQQNFHTPEFFSTHTKTLSDNCQKCSVYFWYSALHAENPLKNLTVLSPPVNFAQHEHPLRFHAPNLVCYCNEKYILQDESVFLLHIFTTIRDNPNEYFAHCVLYYLLLKNFFRKQLVQQCSQIGFEQFQKIKLTGIREHDEKKYENRFIQFAGAGIPNGTIHVEGRFSPKNSYRDLCKLIQQMQNGWKKFIAQDKDVTEFRSNKQLSVSLVAHFIKQKDDVQIDGCQYYTLRQKLINQARILIGYINNVQKNRIDDSPHKFLRITGFDAASNELDTPPEVFAPVYRYLRYHGYTNFSYHAGEDFQHLVSGVRAVDEAIEFLELDSGCRIGHGTALGIDPGLWVERNGESVTLRKQEWLHTMVFALSLLRGNPSFSSEIQTLENDIPELCCEIYGKEYTFNTIHRALTLRYLDPLLIFNATAYNPSDDFFYNEKQKIETAKIKYPKAYNLFCMYQTIPAIGCADLERALRFYAKYSSFYYDKIKRLGKVSVKDAYTTVRTDYFSIEAMTFLQQQVMKKMKEKNIALEALITSNLRISFYESYAEHHILRWLGIIDKYKDEIHPDVCLGTDDPGIFATSVKNEYYHLARMLDQCGIPNHNYTDLLVSIVKNAQAYVFRSA